MKLISYSLNMKAIEIAFIFWLVLGNEIQAHKVCKRILVNSKLTPIDGKLSKNETLGKPEKLQMPKEDTNIPVVPIEVNSTDPSTESVPDIAEGTNEVEILKPEDLSVVTNETTPKPILQDALQMPQNQTYILSLVIVPSIIPNDNEPHVEQNLEFEDSPASTNSSEPLNSTLTKPTSVHANDPIDISIDLTRFLNPKPGFKQEIKRFENSTTSELSEFESEMGVLLEIPSDLEPKHSLSPSSNESIPANKSENTKSPLQIEDVSFFEDFSPVFPLESFFSSLLMPQETIIIETDSEIRNPANFFPMFTAGREIYVVPNNTQPVKKEELASSTLKPEEEATVTQPNSNSTEKD